MTPGTQGAAVRGGTVRIELLGPVRVRVAGAHRPLGGPKQRLALCLLATDVNRVVRADLLIDGLWNGRTPIDPRASLRVYVSNLRSALDGPTVAIEHRDGGYVLEVDADRIDLFRFEDLVERGAPLADRDPQRAAMLLRDALGLWRGRPFGDLAAETALSTDVSRFEQLRLRALEARAAADLAMGEHERLVGELGVLVREHPLRERLHAHRVLALYRSGRQAEALSAYDDARRILTDELGVDPSPFLRELHARILRQDPSLDPPTRSTSSVATLSALRTVRGYALLEEVGVGDLGTVFRARHTDREAEVAVEELTGPQADDPGFVRRFDMAARRSAELQHPHLLTVIDHWREPGGAYLVRPWVTGGTLSSVLTRGPWRLDRALQLLRQVAAAVAHLHAHGLDHRSVSPDSVLLDGDDRALLVDPVARHLDRRASGGSDQDPDVARDVRQLAGLLLALLTGDGTADTADLSKLRPDLPRTMQTSIGRAWETGTEKASGSAAEFVASIERAVHRTTAAADELTAVRNPYKGLHAFAEVDAGDFFGRGGLTRRLVQRLGEPDGRLLAVVGPSGSGKSSAVRAGLVPAVRSGELPNSERWFVSTMYPSEWPMAELERTIVEVAVGDGDAASAALHDGPDGLEQAVEIALPDDGSQLLLLVDQFEEVFSLARQDDREAFLTQLTSSACEPGSRIRIVATVRSDFYDHLLVHPELGGLVADRTVAIPALSEDELSRAVTEPARNVGVTVAPELLATIVADVTDEPGALPLLQYALTELFDRRDGRTLDLRAYQEIGGVRGALAGRAEGLYRRLDDPGKQVCRQVFLRLVSVGHGTTETKRRVLRSELRSAGDTRHVERVLESFGNHRLLTFDRDPFTRAPSVEVAHEALTRRWGRLRGWIDGARDDIVMHRRLVMATDEWHLAERDPSYLLRDGKLDRFAEWADTSTVVLTDAERGFLHESLAARAQREAQEQARKAREQRFEQRSVRRLRTLVAVLAVGVVSALALTAFAFQQRDRARESQEIAEAERTAAQQQERVATARELAAAAIGELERDQERSVLLAMEAVRATLDADGRALPEAEAALHSAVRESRIEQAYAIGGGFALGPDGTLAITGMDGTLTVLGPDGEVRFERDDRPTHPLILPGNNAPTTFLERTADVDLSPDARKLATTDERFNVRIVDARTGDVLVELDRRAIRPVFSPDGTAIAAVLVQEGTTAQWDAGRTLGLWDTQTGELIQLLEGHEKSILDHAFSPDGTQLATASPSGDRIGIWDVTTGDSLIMADRPAAKAVAFSPDGSKLVVGGGDGMAELRDATTLEELHALRGHEGDLFAVAFSPDGSRVAVGGHGAEIFDAETGDQILAVAGHGFMIADLAFNMDGTQLVTSAEDGTTREWDVAFAGGREVVTLPGPPAPAHGALAFSPQGLLAAAAPDGLRLYDTTTWQVVRTLSVERGAVREIAFDHDGTRIAASTFTPPPGPGVEGAIVVWDTTSGERLLEVPGHGGTIWDLDFSPDGTLIATGTANEGMVRILDTTTGEVGTTYQLEEGSVTSVEFTPNGQQLFVGGQDAGYLIDPTNGDELTRFTEADESILDDRLMADGRLVTGDVAGRVQTWNLQNGTVIETLTYHRQGVWAVAEHGGLVAAATPDGLDLIDLHDETRRFTLTTGHDRGAVDLGFSPEGRHLATAGADGSVRVFLTQIQDLLDLAHRRVTRTLTDDECQRFLHLEACPA